MAAHGRTRHAEVGRRRTRLEAAGRQDRDALSHVPDAEARRSDRDPAAFQGSDGNLTLRSHAKRGVSKGWATRIVLAATLRDASLRDAPQGEVFSSRPGRGDSSFSYSPRARWPHSPPPCPSARP